ncbi:MAG: cysteine hydrolase [Actinomycetota bacterium]
MLVIELQNDLCAPQLAEQRGLRGALARAVRDRGLLDRLVPVLSACRARGVPVIYLTKERHPSIPEPAGPPIFRMSGREPTLVHGTWGAQVLDEIAPEDGDLVLPRFTSIDPSHGTELWAICENLCLQTLVLAGISTTLAVEGTARAAANREYRTVVIEDCCASVPDEWHRFSADNVLPLIADVVSSDDVVSALS